MALAPGTKLGPYEIVAPIGAGGMGEVFKARDTRLDRIVAIKVLPTHIAAREELRVRFEREARTVSSLNHPNICVIYDIGKQEGTDFMVLEYLDGETLAARVARGPMPIDQVLKYSIQIADALDRAHRSGVSHRDVKPGNVMITRDGCKVLDFGLAKTAPKTITQTDSTLTAALTGEGTILGTPQYMAPEQYEGKEADARSDIFAFACVVYEMVTGKRCFEGKTRASLIAAVVGGEPVPMSARVPVTPAALERLVKRCLEKDPEDRYQSMRDVVLDLRAIGEGETGGARAEAGARPAPVLIAAAIGALALGGAIAWWLKPAPAVAHVVSRFSFTLPEGENFTSNGRHTIALSPDGTKLVYVANQRLYLRAMNQLDAQPIRGTDEDPREPVFSPDGQWLAYFVPAEGDGAGSNGRFVLNKIAVAGGAPVTLGQLASAPEGATWQNQTITFAINTASVVSVQTIPDSGGTLHTIFEGDPGKERFMQPQLLPDGKHVMFVSVPRTTATGGQGGEGQIVIQSLDGGGKDRRTLVAMGTDPHVLPAGQLVYLHDGKLLAVPFDIDRMAVTGGAVSILEGVTETIAGQFAVSAEGALAFRPGGVSVGKRLLVWVDREGHEQPISAKARVYVYPRISPDGTKIAFSSADDEHDIWIFDLAKETPTRLTFGPAFELYAAWAPDSKYVLFSSGPVAPAGVATPLDIFRKTADGTGTAEALTRQTSGGYPTSVSPDGKSLIFRRYFPNPSSISGLYLLPLDPAGEVRALLADPKFSQTNGEISPNGRWIAYESNESGRPEVYVRPFPAVDSGRWQISSERGTEPMWSRSGSELFFAASDHLAVVSVSAGTTFTYGKPQQLFDTRAYYIGLGGGGRTFDISPDGKRLLMVKTVGSGGTTDRPSIVVVSHWFDEVRAGMGSK